MKLLLLTLCILSTLSCSSRKKITAKTAVSTAIVKLRSPMGGHGTGFYISPTEIVSAKHVCTIPWVTPSDFSKVEEIIIDDYSDLCYIRVSGGNPHSFFYLSYEELAIGDQTCNAGYGSFGYVYNCGKIFGMLRFYELGMLNWLYFSEQFAIPGMSGGPVFYKGKVVGVTVINYHAKLGFVSNQQVKRFLNKVRK